MINRRAVVALAVCAAPSLSRARAETRVGIAPDQAALVRGEALTASTRGAQALFYNPAGLARWYWSTTIVDAYDVVDQEAIDLSRRFQRQYERGEDPDLNELYALARNGKTYAFDVGVSALRIELPYVAMQSFGNGRATLSHGDGYYDIDTVAHAGAIVGGALSYRWLAIGVSRYYLLRAHINAKPSDAQVDEIVQGLEDGSLREEDVPHQDFARVEAGNGLGNNVGMLIRPFAGNPSGIGVAVLNTGDTGFTRRALVNHPKVQAGEARFARFAEDHRLTLETPEPLPQMVNAGLSVGVGGDDESILTALAEVDWHDLGGDATDHKLAASGELGFRLPRDVASVVAVQYKHDKTTYQVGILGARALAGIREAEASSYGFETTFHAGAERVSPIELSIRYQVRESLAGEHRRQGVGFDLGLTLVY